MGLNQLNPRPTGNGTMHMPEKPDTWAVFIAWLQLYWPAIYGGGLSCVIAALRVVYDGGDQRQVVLEGLLCGALTLAVSAALEWLKLPSSLAPFFGGFIGLVGVEGVRRLANSHLSKKVDRA